jgi:transposase-like protein
MKPQNNQKVIRTFSPEFKRKIVAEIQQGKLRPAEVARSYRVSRSAIYKWIDRFGAMTPPAERLVLESDADTRKAEVLALRVAELERVVGQKQLQIDVLTRRVKLAEEHCSANGKKNFAPSLSSPSARIRRRGGR